MLGDKWSLLVLRDLMVRNARTFKDLMACPEKIASNILADRLKKLIASGIITARQDPTDARKLTYLLTKKGIDLAPVLAELVLWVARHEKTGNQPLVKKLCANKEGFIAAVREEWERGSPKSNQSRKEDRKHKT